MEDSSTQYIDNKLDDSTIKETKTNQCTRSTSTIESEDSSTPMKGINTEIISINDNISNEDMLYEVHKMFLANEKLKQRMLQAEIKYKKEKVEFNHMKKEYKQLKETLLECKRITKKEKKAMEIIQNATISTHSKAKDGIDPMKKERKKFRRFVSKLKLQLQLVKSEHDKHLLWTEKQLHELRQEYADNYLFPESVFDDANTFLGNSQL